MKRTGIWMLIVCIALCTVTPIFAASEGVMPDVEGTDCERAVRELVNLHIMEGYEDGTFRPDSILSRAEFSAFITRVLAMDQSAETMKDRTIFHDVPPDHWAAGYIHTAADLGIINGYGDGTFGPEDEVTFEQACKMVLESMGYGIPAIERGGYPQGYLAVAVQSGIARNVKVGGSDPLPRGEAAKMIAEALDVDVIEKNYGTETYTKLQGVTLRTRLCDQLGLEKKEGVVTANAYTSLSGMESMADGRIIIDDETYRVGRENLNRLLGYHVEYYAKTDAAGNQSLYSIQPSAAKNKTASFLADDVVKIEPDMFTVYLEDGSKKQEYRLDTPVKTVYNGKYMPNAESDDWNIKSGRIRLLDHDGDSRYDIVFIEEIQPLLVDRVDQEKEVIHLRTFSDQLPNTYRGKTFIDCQGTDPMVVYHNLNGEELELSSVEPMRLIGVMESKDNELVTIIPGGEPFSGTVEQVESGRDRVTVDGEQYYLAKNNMGEQVLSLQAGDEGKFWPDVLGRIAAKDLSKTGGGYGEAVETVNRDLICSYLLAANIEGGLSPSVQMKLLTNLADGTREERVFELADHVMVNGSKTAAADVLNAIKDANNGDYHIPMTYELNGKGKIKSLWMFTQTVPMGYMTYQSANASFNGLYYQDDSSITYFVDVRDYGEVFGKTEIKLNNGSKYQVRIFDPAGEDFSIKKRIFIVYLDLENAGATELDANTPFLVSDILQYDDGDGEIAYLLEGLAAGQQRKVKVSEEQRTRVKQLRIGSLIRFSQNGLGELKDIKVLAQLPPESFYRKGIGGNNEQIFGTAAKIERNSDYSSCILTVSYGQGGPEPQASYEIAGKPVYLFDHGKVSSAETGEIGETDQVFLSVVNFDAKAIIIIR